MKQHLLHSVIDDLLDAVERHPELTEPAMRFVFDEAHAIRKGMCDVQTRVGTDVRHADGSVSLSVGCEVLASRELIHFAHAVANGGVPEMPLRDSVPAS